MDIYLARQPIFTKKKNICAYELLFRNGPCNAFPDVNGDTASSKFLANSFFTMGIDSIMGVKKAYINFTETLLLKKVPMMFPAQEIIVEVLEHVSPTPDVISACREMSQAGYGIPRLGGQSGFSSIGLTDQIIADLSARRDDAVFDPDALTHDYVIPKNGPFYADRARKLASRSDHDPVFKFG
jgi:hypothetical protein